MKTSRIFFARRLGAFALVAASWSAVAAAPPPGDAAAAAAAGTAIDAGRYVATAAGCQACHSRPGGVAFAGGAALPTPFGQLYAPNITPDVEHGIGTWSEADVTRALRDGVGKGGKWLYPAMPYDHYTKISDDDIHALWAYLRSVPAAAQPSTENAMSFPFNQRAGLAVWQRAFFTAGRYAPVAGKSPAWNRGAYLVEALGHCGACHTPRNLAMASDANRQLTGARIDGWYAPDISAGPGSTLARRSANDIAAFLKTGQSRGNASVFGPMDEVVHDSLAKLTDADRLAIATYLKDPPAPVNAPKATPTPVPAATLTAGAAVYAEHCAACHQRDGRGMRAAVPALAGNAAVTAREADNVVSAVLGGFDQHGTWGAMPALAGALDDMQIAAVANYVRHAWGNHGEHAATPRQVAQLRPLAEAPTNGERAALACPILPDEVLQPALKAGSAALERAANAPARMQKLVRDYRAARPGAPVAQVVEALGTAYCRTVAADGATTLQAGARMADFSQQAAAAVIEQGPHGRLP